MTIQEICWVAGRSAHEIGEEKGSVLRRQSEGARLEFEFPPSLGREEEARKKEEAAKKAAEIKARATKPKSPKKVSSTSFLFVPYTHLSS